MTHPGLIPGLLSRHQAWRSGVLHKIRSKDLLIMNELRETIPEELEVLFRETTLLNRLVEHGTTGAYIFHVSDGEKYGYMNLNSLRKHLRILQISWRGIITIQMRKLSQDEMEVTLSAA